MALYRVKILLISGGFLLIMWWVVPLFLWPKPRQPKPKSATNVSQTPADPPAPEKSTRRDDPASTFILEPTTNPVAPVETQIHFEPLTSSKHSPDATILDFRGQEKPSSPGDTIIDPRGMETLIRFPAEPPRSRKEKKEE
jgi:hypothetical protein